MAMGSFLIFCNLYLFQPIMPLFASEMNISATKVNWIFASTTLMLSLALVPWAMCSESFGRKKVLLAGLFLPPLIHLVLLFRTDFTSIVIARGCMGIALAAFISVAVAYMAEELSPKALAQAVGGYIAANSLGGITGRIAGGVLTDWFNWQTAVIVISVITLAGAFVVQRALPEQQYFTPQRQRFSHHKRLMLQHLKNKNVWFAMLLGGLNFALFVNLFSVIGFRLSEPPYNLPPSITSLIFLCYLSGTMSSQFSGRWTLHFDSVSGMLAGAVVSCMGMCLAYYESITMMIIGLLLISLGSFFTHALAYGWVSQKATTAKATATALYLVHYYVGGSLGGFFLIYCWQHGAWKTVMTGASVLYLLIFFLSYKLKRTKATPAAAVHIA